MPNHNDYFQKHQTISNNRNNTKSWQEVHVGPGLVKVIRLREMEL